MQQPPKVYGMPSQYGQASSAPGYGGRAPNQQYTAHASGWFSYLVYTISVFINFNPLITMVEFLSVKHSVFNEHTLLMP